MIRQIYYFSETHLRDLDNSAPAPDPTFTESAITVQARSGSGATAGLTIGPAEAAVNTFRESIETTHFERDDVRTAELTKKIAAVEKHIGKKDILPVSKAKVGSYVKIQSQLEAAAMTFSNVQFPGRNADFCTCVVVRSIGIDQTTMDDQPYEICLFGSTVHWGDGRLPDEPGPPTSRFGEIEALLVSELGPRTGTPMTSSPEETIEIIDTVSIQEPERRLPLEPLDETEVVFKVLGLAKDDTRGQLLVGSILWIRDSE